MGRITIDDKTCKGCLLCVEVCPKGVLKPSDQINNKGYYTVTVADPDNCTGCAACAQRCPDIAIKEVYR
jgi:2-oxoglutarate ferredoxin oxidoreductase subunit delta